MYRGLLIANIGVGVGEPVECPPVILLHSQRWLANCYAVLKCCLLLSLLIVVTGHVVRVERAGLVEEARFIGHVDHRSILSFSVRSWDLSSCSARILFPVHLSILSMIMPLNLSYSLANSRGYISLLLALSLRPHVASQPNSADEIAGVTDFGNWLRFMGSTAQAT